MSGGDATTGESRRIETGYGALDVPLWLLRVWDNYGWPEESVLREMVGPSRAVWCERSGAR